MTQAEIHLDDLSYPLVIATFPTLLSPLDWERYHDWLIRQIKRGSAIVVIHDHTAGGIPTPKQLELSLRRADELSVNEVRRVLTSFIVSASAEAQASMTALFWTLPNPLWPCKVVASMREAVAQADALLRPACRV